MKLTPDQIIDSAIAEYERIKWMHERGLKCTK